MEMALGTVLGAGWASGVNLYGTVLLLGLCHLNHLCAGFQFGGALV